MSDTDTDGREETGPGAGRAVQRPPQGWFERIWRLTTSAGVPLVLLWILAFSTHALLLAWPLTSATTERQCSEERPALHLVSARPLVQEMVFFEACNGVSGRDAERAQMPELADETAPQALLTDAAAQAETSGEAGAATALDADAVDADSVDADPGPAGDTAAEPAAPALKAALAPAPVQDAAAQADAPAAADRTKPSVAPGLFRGNALFIAVLAAGAMGGAVNSLRNHIYHVARGTHDPRWALWNILRPVSGGALAVLFFFMLRAGLVQSNGNDGLRPEGFIAMAALVGLFADHAWAKLRSVAESVFAPSGITPGSSTSSSSSASSGTATGSGGAGTAA